jgi:transcriptional regulator with XRE-family HTH domain
MNGLPDPPPEGALIEASRKVAGLSVREAARRAGISEGWWRQIVKGYQILGGGIPGPVRGTAETVARMAQVAGVAPEALEAQGHRRDAAVILAGILDAQRDTGRPDPVRAHLYAALAAVNAPLRDQVLAEAASGRPFTDELERLIWESPGWPDEEKATEIANFRARRADGAPSRPAEAG